MIPEFGRIFDEGIPAYFVMMIVAFAVTVALAARSAQRSGYERDVMIDLGLVTLIAGVAGARILHVFVDGYFWDYVHLCTDPSQVTWHISRVECLSPSYGGTWDAAIQRCRPPSGDCFAWAKFWQGGLVWYGGLIGAGAYGIYFLYKERFPVLKGIDIAGMMIPLGVFFGRLGCWFGGCCFGLRSDHWSAVSFPPWSAASEEHFREGLLSSPEFPSLPVLPAQLYEALGCLAVSAFCMFVVHPNKRFDGQVFCVSMIGYAIVRFALEYVRADDRGALLWFTTSQWIGLLIVAAGAVIWAAFARRAREKLARPLEQSAAA